MGNDTKQTAILVTGGAGFIGTNFIYHALAAKPDWRIVNLDALFTGGNRDNFRNLPVNQKKRYRFIHGQIQDTALLESLFAEEKFAGVFHLAAQTHVDRSITRPEEFVDTNITGTFRLLEVCRRHWLAGKLPPGFRIIHVSTDEVFGSLGGDGFFCESTPYDPSSPYSASKAASDHLVRAWFRTYGLPAIITNCSNNYGPYQYPEKLIPLIIRNIVAEKELPVYGDGRNIRDWLYVADHCRALMMVYETGACGETYAVGGGAERENIELVGILCDLLDARLGRAKADSSRKLIRFVTDRPGHDRRYAINAARIKERLGWQPGYSFEEALGKTVDWYLANRAWLDGSQ